MNGAELIAAERKRQVEVEDWKPEHDDSHTTGELALAAAVYAMPREDRNKYILNATVAEVFWPWGLEWFKPANSKNPKARIRELVKAGALLAAEIDRIKRQIDRLQRQEGQR